MASLTLLKLKLVRAIPLTEMTFFTYLKQQSKIYSLFFGFLLIFLISFFLYRLPIAAVLYPAALCLLIGFVVEIFRYFKIRELHKSLDNISTSSSETITELPKTLSVQETDYQKIINNLLNEINVLKTDHQINQNEITEYFSMWVHQIKTPITAMKLILSEEDSPISRALTSELLKIEQYVSMVLTYLRLDFDSTDYVFENTDIDALIRGSLIKFSNEFISRKLQLDYESTDYAFITDKKWFSFMFEQLLSNALKYTKKGSIRIYMKDHKLYIIDTGYGIAAQDLPRIFEKGFTGYTGHNNKNSSGLGLYLTKRICENLSIPIHISSEVGTGTCVELNLNQPSFKVE